MILLLLKGSHMAINMQETRQNIYCTHQMRSNNKNSRNKRKRLDLQSQFLVAILYPKIHKTLRRLDDLNKKMPTAEFIPYN